MAIAKAIKRLSLWISFEEFRFVILHIDLVVGWFLPIYTHDSFISVVGSFLHHDEAVTGSLWRELEIIYGDTLPCPLYKLSIQILYLYRFDYSLSIMADNLRRAIQDLNLGIDDAPVVLSAAVCSEARRVNQFSLMGRPSMQTKQNIRALLSALPKMWGVPGLINGRIVERRKFQFIFPSEEMLSSVLERGPWAVNERMLIMTRWNAGMDDRDLNHIPFWVQIRGIPLEYLSEPVIRNIGDRMGEVMKVDFNPEVNAAVEFVRVRLNWDVSKPLKFKRNFQFSPGINTLLKFRYERLKGFCDQCGMITHDSGECLPEEGHQMEEDNVGDDPHNGEGGAEDDGGRDANNPEDTGMEIQEQQDGLEMPAQVNQNQTGGSSSGSFVALMQNFWSNAPVEVVRREYERRVGPVRMKRRNDFIDALLEEGSSSHQTEAAEDQDPAQLEIESDEDADHAILEWQARRYEDIDIRQYGSFLQGEHDQNMEGNGQASLLSNTCLGKRSREELNEETIDKFPVGKMRMSAEFNALHQLQETYGHDQDQDDTSQIDRGAVGPVPPDSP
ncbi:hypothetical protein Bca101_060903 [Brassica carinata]